MCNFCVACLFNCINLFQDGSRVTKFKNQESGIKNQSQALSLHYWISIGII
jgi:hypothetical protein